MFPAFLILVQNPWYKKVYYAFRNNIVIFNILTLFKFDLEHILFIIFATSLKFIISFQRIFFYQFVVKISFLAAQEAKAKEAAQKAAQEAKAKEAAEDTVKTEVKTE